MKSFPIASEGYTCSRWFWGAFQWLGPQDTNYWGQFTTKDHIKCYFKSTTVWANIVWLLCCNIQQSDNGMGIQHNARLQHLAHDQCPLYSLPYHTMTFSCLQNLPFHSPVYNTSIACMQTIMWWKKTVQLEVSKVSSPTRRQQLQLLKCHI